MKGDEFRFQVMLLRKLDQIITLLKSSLKEEKIMSAELDALEAEVKETEGVEASAVTLLQGVAAQIDALAAELAAEGIDNAKVSALSAELKASTDALAAAVATVPPAPPTF